MNDVERRLAAIMFTDIVGYSALTGRDEMLAMELLREHHELLRPVFVRHGGIEVKTIGDSFMVEFPSVVNAVSSAIEMQQTLADRNSAESSQRQLVVRIGIHVGDVILRDKDVFGDGVNIASRIEPLAQPGGICVSEDVARQIRNKIAFPVTELGSAQLKNIELPVKVFAIQLPWLKPQASGAAAKSMQGAKARLSPSASGSWMKWGAAAVVLLIVAAGVLALTGLDFGRLEGDLAGAMSSVEEASDPDGSAELAGDVSGEGASASDAAEAASSAPAAAAPRPAAPVRSGPSAESVRRAARAAFDAGTYADAIEQYRTLTRLAPRDADSFYYLGRSYALTDDTEQAITNLTQATSLQDKSPLYHIHLGIALESAGRFENALTQMQKAVELGGHPDFDDADLADRVGRLAARLELAELAPFSAPAKHDHLIGSCSGSLTMTDLSVAYVTSGDHAFNVWFKDVATIDARNDSLGLEFRAGGDFNFELSTDEVDRFRRIYDLANTP